MTRFLAVILAAAPALAFAQAPEVAGRPVFERTLRQGDSYFVLLGYERRFYAFDEHPERHGLPVEESLVHRHAFRFKSYEVKTDGSLTLLALAEEYWGPTSRVRIGVYDLKCGEPIAPQLAGRELKNSDYAERVRWMCRLMAQQASRRLETEGVELKVQPPVR